MKINWTVRIKNKNFWLALVPAVLLLLQAVLALFGVEWQPDALSDQLLDIINAAFVLLSILGVVQDPTTAGAGDSEQALTYSRPRKEE